jgi:hypothetical protein
MRVQGKNRWWHGLMRWGYTIGLHAWFRWGRNPLSRITGYLRPRHPWQPPSFTTLDEAAAWFRSAFIWTSDPLRGLFDIIPSLENVAYQVHREGVVREDCDGLAFTAAQLVIPFADRSPAGLPHSYIVTMLLDPLKVSVFDSAHAMTFFRTDGHWRVVSNHELMPESWDSFYSALTQNGYVSFWQSPVLFAEVRDHLLHFIGSGTGEAGLKHLGKVMG